MWSYWQEKQIMGPSDPKSVFVGVTGMHYRFKWRKSWGSELEGCRIERVKMWSG